MQKFLIDQNIPQGVIDWLTNEGFDVKLVRKINPEMTDIKVLETAIKEKRILLTNDTDFVGLWYAKQKGDCIIFRMKSQKSFSRILLLKKIFAKTKKKNGLLILEA